MIDNNMLENVIKRDGDIVRYDKEKVVQAIRSAEQETEESIDDMNELINSIEEVLVDNFSETNLPNVEQIQDIVEEKLMLFSYIKTAKRYIIYRQERAKKRSESWLTGELPMSIFERKYRIDGESLDEFLNRITEGNNKVKKHIKDQYFMPAGRILANRGLQKRGKKVTYSNCYVITPPKDSIESIFDVSKKLARTFSYGGGAGVDISNLRPKDSIVNNGARKTSGAVSFMPLYSLTTNIIGQRGRRGALMISLDINHPDIEEFIDIKNDLEAVTKANISLKITDDFMEAVANDEEHELYFYVDDTGEEIKREVNARRVFNKIAYSNWNMAEPGFLFWDNIENYNLLSEEDGFEYSGVNPCFTGDMELLTQDGYKRFDELAKLNTRVNVVNKDGKVTSGNVWSNGFKDIVEVNFYNKKSIKCTPDHVFMTNEGKQVEAQYMKGKRTMPYVGKNTMYNSQFTKLGFMQGDASLGRVNSDEHKGIDVHIGENDNDLLELFGVSEDDVYSDNYTYYINEFNDIIDTLGFSTKPLPKRTLPTTFNVWDKTSKLSFIRGLYSANGSVIGSIYNGRVTLKSTSKGLVKEVYEFLEKQGFSPYITTTVKPTNAEFDNGECTCKQSYDLNLRQHDDKVRFLEEIGFVQKYKEDKLIRFIQKTAPYVTSVKKLEKEEVFDFSEPKTHWGVVEGATVHNCAEEPLPAGGSCLLSSLNLSEFVEKPFTDEAYFNFDKFEEVVEDGVKFLNEVLDEGVPLHPLQEQRDSVDKWRQIGLGVMGIADMLIKLNVEYGSEESLDINDSIASKMANTALKTSAELAKEQATYPEYSEDVLKSDYLNSVGTPETIDKIKKYGLRNSQLLTIAPTGSISSMLGISGGIEPIFDLSYTRTTQTLYDEDVEYEVFTPIVEEYMEEMSVYNKDDLPEIFVTAHDLDYKQRINMQSVWQKYIDASISSTINLDNSTTVDEIKDVYKYAWQKDLKGITVYRDGCARSGILSSGDDNSENKVELNDADLIEQGICPDCKGELVNTGGCQECKSCGFSVCSI